MIIDLTSSLFTYVMTAISEVQLGIPLLTYIDYVEDYWCFEVYAYGAVALVATRREYIPGWANRLTVKLMSEPFM